MQDRGKGEGVEGKREGPFLAAVECQFLVVMKKATQSPICNEA